MRPCEHDCLLEVVCRLWDDWEPKWDAWLRHWEAERSRWLNASRAFGAWLREQLDIERNDAIAAAFDSHGRKTKAGQFCREADRMMGTCGCGDIAAAIRARATP